MNFSPPHVAARRWCNVMSWRKNNSVPGKWPQIWGLCDVSRHFIIEIDGNRPSCEYKSYQLSPSILKICPSLSCWHPVVSFRFRGWVGLAVSRGPARGEAAPWRPPCPFCSPFVLGWRWAAGIRCRSRPMKPGASDESCQSLSTKSLYASDGKLSAAKGRSIRIWTLGPFWRQKRSLWESIHTCWGSNTYRVVLQVEGTRATLQKKARMISVLQPNQAEAEEHSCRARRNALAPMLAKRWRPKEDESRMVFGHTVGTSRPEDCTLTAWTIAGKFSQWSSHLWMFKQLKLMYWADAPNFGAGGLYLETAQSWYRLSITTSTTRKGKMLSRCISAKMQIVQKQTRWAAIWQVTSQLSIAPQNSPTTIMCSKRITLSNCPGAILSDSSPWGNPPPTYKNSPEWSKYFF